MTTATVYLAMGSNVQPARHLRDAVAALRERFGELRLSRLYRTVAAGFDGPDFLNAAACLRTDLSPRALDAWLHALEARHGRRRDVPRFSSRTLDLDLLLYDDLVLEAPGQPQLPRAELASEPFVLRPMLDIAADLVHPTLHQSLATLWEHHPRRCDLPVVDWDGAPA